MTPEEINEALKTLLSAQVLCTVLIPHPVLKIQATGYLRYCGDNIWAVNKICFPQDFVAHITAGDITIKSL